MKCIRGIWNGIRHSYLILIRCELISSNHLIVIMGSLENCFYSKLRLFGSKFELFVRFRIKGYINHHWSLVRTSRKIFSTIGDIYELFCRKNSKQTWSTTLENDNFKWKKLKTKRIADVTKYCYHRSKRRNLKVALYNDAGKME